MVNRFQEPVVPDGGWGWIIVLSSFMIHFIMDGMTYSMGGIFLSPMMKHLNESRGSVSFIFGILPAVTRVTGPVATVLTNMYGCRKVAIAGACLAASGFLASYFWANLWFYYLTIGIIGGIGCGLLYLPAIVSVSFYFERKRSSAMGIAVCGSGVGTMVIPAVMSYITRAPLSLDYKTILLIEAAALFSCVIFGALMIPLPQEPSEQRRLERKARLEAKRRPLQKDIEMTPYHEQQTHLISSSIQESENNAKTISELPEENFAKHTVLSHEENCNELTVADHQLDKKSFIQKLAQQIDFRLLQNGGFAIFVVSGFFTALGFYVPYSFANDLATDAQVAEHRKHWIFMSIGVTNCLGRMIFGYLGDRPWVDRLTLFSISLIVAGLATMSAPFCNSLVQTHMIYAGMFGFFAGGCVVLASVIITDLVGINKLSDAFGVLLLVHSIAIVIGTPIAGWMRDSFSGFSRPYLWPYLTFGGSILFSGLILFGIPMLKSRKQNCRQSTTHEQPKQTTSCVDEPQNV